MLGAGAAVATVAAAPALTQTGAQMRTLYVAKSGRALPQTIFVRPRDCLRRPRSCVNGLGGRELVYLTRGRMPMRATSATVLTDTDCGADQNGISHCRNAIRLESGELIVVRHDHRMMNDPCLQPGERVRVRRLS